MGCTLSELDTGLVQSPLFPHVFSGNPVETESSPCPEPALSAVEGRLGGKHSAFFEHLNDWNDWNR